MLIRVLSAFMLLSSFQSLSTELNVCYEEWRPYAYKTKSGIYTGVILDKLLKTAKSTDIQLVLHELPHTRCIEAVKGKKMDFALFVDVNDGLNLLNKKLSTWELAIATRAGEMPSEEQKLSAQYIKNITIARDYVYPEALNKLLVQLNKPIIKVSHYVQQKEDAYRIFRALLDYRVDAMVVDRVWANNVKSELSLPFEVSTWTLHKEPQFVGYSYQSDQKESAINTLLKAIE